MNQIVNDWLKYCEGSEAFEDDYFYTLFMDEISVEEIEAIYKTFPNSEKLIKRMKQYLFGKNPKVNDSDKVFMLENLIKLDFEERMPILELLPNFSTLKTNLKFIYEENVEVVNKLVLNDVWIQDFHDFMIRQMIIEDKKAFELYNALYGKTFDFDYQQYLFQPLFNTEYKMEYLFQFKKLGGVYAITESALYFSTKENGTF